MGGKDTYSLKCWRPAVILDVLRGCYNFSLWSYYVDLYYCYDVDGVYDVNSSLLLIRRSPNPEH